VIIVSAVIIALYVRNHKKKKLGAISAGPEK